MMKRDASCGGQSFFILTGKEVIREFWEVNLSYSMRPTCLCKLSGQRSVGAAVTDVLGVGGREALVLADFALRVWNC